MAVYEINEAQNNAITNTNKDLVAGYANKQVEETLQKKQQKLLKWCQNLKDYRWQQVQSKEDFSATEINNLVSSANQLVDAVSNNKVNFQYDESKEQHIVLVRDKDTDEIIREIPPKEMLDLLKNLEDITGIIYDNKI